MRPKSTRLSFTSGSKQSRSAVKMSASESIAGAEPETAGPFELCTGSPLAGGRADLNGVASGCFISSSALAFPLNKIAGYGLESVGAAAIGREGRKGFLDQLGGVALALLDTENCRPGRFFSGFVFACGLAQMSRIYRQVQNIVHNLKCEACLAAKLVQ